MKFSVVLALVVLMAVAASAVTTDRLASLKQHVDASVQLGMTDKEVQSVFQAAEAEVHAKIAAGAKGLTCSGKITAGKLAAYFAKKANNGQGVKKFEEWAKEGTTVVTVLAEANASAAAAIGISIGFGVAFEFAVEWAGTVPSFKDAAISLCSNFDITIGVQFGANAGGTLYLIFGDIEKAKESNCGVGAEVFAGIGGGVQIMMKCVTPADTAKAWTDYKAANLAKPEKATIYEKIKLLAKSIPAAFKATVIGVAFSAGVGVGGTPVSATVSIQDIVEKAIPSAWKDWAESAKDSIETKWKEFKAWVKK